MVLKVYRSNRAELLAQVLAAELQLQPPDPFEQVQVLVNTWPTSRWLGEQLAVALGGIAANLRFPFPGGHLRQLVQILLGETHELVGVGRDPWRATELVWPVLELLPAIAAADGSGPLQRWLARHDLSRRLERGSWQLGRTIADALDDYALYRPDLLARWDAGESVDGRGRPLPAGQRWQMELYRALRQRLTGDPFGLQVERAIEQLRRGQRPAALAGRTLRLFGISSLAPSQVRLLQGLSGVMSVHLYLLTPCRLLWQRCEDRRRRLRDALALREPLEADWLLEAPGLEARFGRLGGDFQQLLEGTGEAQLGEWQEGDLFFAPASRLLAGAGPGMADPLAAGPAAAAGPVPLLAQLQEQLADPQAWPQLSLAAGDHSLEFHPCPGPLRQVQIVRDRLLQLLAADPSLEPRHILVMTPGIDRLAPLVASVFADTDATGVELPWRLTDRSQQSEAGIGRSLLAMLELAGGRLTASGLESLLDCPPLQRRFGLAADEIAALHTTLQRCGFRWGLGPHDRGGDACHTLSWAIDRLLLGLVLPCRPGLAPAEVAPAELGATPLELAGRWLQLLGRLRHWLEQLRSPSDCHRWGERLQALLADLFADDLEQAWELARLQVAIDDWLAAAGDCSLLLEAPVVAAVLDERLAAESGRFGHRSGAVTISALEPMRAIPHRVVVLMGLDADSFPRQQFRPGFHLLEQERRLGDPHPADQDRYVLLEALLSARDHLLITWSCRDDRRGEALQPASPVRQWLQWLESQLGSDAAAALVAEHAASPLDRRNFQPQPSRPSPSCDRRLLEARRRLDSGPAAPALGLAATPPPLEAVSVTTAVDPFADLQDWLCRPQEHWLRQLGLRPREWMDERRDLEALSLAEWQRAQLLRAWIAAGGLEAEQDSAAPADWLERHRGQGMLPPLAAAELEAQGLAQRCSSLRQTLQSLGPAWQEPLSWQQWRAAPLWHGRQLVLVRTGKARCRDRLQLWLQLLLAVAAADCSGRRPEGAVLIGRDGQRFAILNRLAPPEPASAQAELERLAALRQQWHQRCWPVPHETGWAFLQAERKRADSGLEAAIPAWEGHGQSAGERQQPEMALCFGVDLPTADLIDSRFQQLAETLLAPMQEALRRR